MSRHQYIRNLDYEDAVEEYEGYSEGEDELSAEDRALMNQGTADVQAALGVEVSKVTTAQIQEALWHYYYDVDKSVAYLISKFINPPVKEKKQLKTAVPPPKAILTNPTAPSQLSPFLPAYEVPSPRTSPPIALLFQDMPWGNIPKSRETTFIPPMLPRGGLLGGSGAPPKLSKLQALAAARKKKAEEKKVINDKVEQTRAVVESLTVEDGRRGKENESLNGPPGKRPKTSEPATFPSHGVVESHHNAPRVEGHRQHDADSSKLQSEALQPEVQPNYQQVVAEPSAFAQLLCGPPSITRELQIPTGPSEAFGYGYGADNQGNPPKTSLSTTDWFDVRKRKLDECEDVVVLYPNLPQSVRDAFAKPSPDDIVLAAQAKAKTKAGTKAAAAQPKKKGAASTDTVAAGVEGLKIDDTPLPKSRNLDVLSELEKSKPKKNASFVVVGHVDAGKSTMMGRLLLDLKVVDQRTVDKLHKEAKTEGKGSFGLAWVLDQRPEERSRGITMDIATKRFETEHTAFTILDAPGHAEYIYNMIAGASQADFAILVIDASIDAFESGLKGQTREHSLLIRSMGVSRVIVAVNKLDTVAWSQERFNEIRDQMSGFLSTAGFQQKNIAFVPVSGLHGDNLVHRSSEPAASWYNGPTLIQELENSEPNARALSKPLRMTVFEVYRTMQSPVTVSGRIEAGSLQMGDALLVQPSGEKAYVKSILSNEAPVDWAVAGQNVVLHLSQIDPIHVRDGDIICDPNHPIPRADTFTLKALAFDILMPMPVEVHRGRLNQAGKIEVIPAILDKTSGKVTKKNPKIVKPAMVARVVVKLESQVPLEAGQRVVLRSGGQTVAAGLLE
ncbi:hypothetical protein B0J18DRAFT_436557 [Chaetomium sp. MPI-SDFR-AT-0129]|nr:hypothetical protein B0J18DRAFT_436557 [Chaetomium sp. MPI-SDFR-AT-0129]